MPRLASEKCSKYLLYKVLRVNLDPLRTALLSISLSLSYQLLEPPCQVSQEQTDLTEDITPSCQEANLTTNNNNKVLLKVSLSPAEAEDSGGHLLPVLLLATMATMVEEGTINKVEEEATEEEEEDSLTLKLNNREFVVHSHKDASSKTHARLSLPRW